jgi:hypothetical protein
LQKTLTTTLLSHFDEVEILDQVSSYWMKPDWLSSLKEYYAKEPERLKQITS